MVVKGDPGSEAWTCIVQLFKSRDNERRFTEIAEAVNLAPRLVGGLLRLAPGEAMQMRAMVQEWHCDPSWVSTIVDELEQRGLVERRVDAVDRRAKTVNLTGLGEETRAEVIDLLSVPPPAIAALTKEEQRTLRDLMRKVTADLPSLR